MSKKNVTTEQIVETAMAKISDNITTLGVRRDNALSVFRQTANDLGVINSNLSQNIQEMNRLAQFVNAGIDSATQMVADNEAVRARILEIIGEK